MSAVIEKWWWVILLIVLVGLWFLPISPNPPTIHVQHLPGVWWLPDEGLDSYWTFEANGSYEILIYSKFTVMRWIVGTPTIKGRWQVVGDQLQLTPTEVPFMDKNLAQPQTHLIEQLTPNLLQLAGWGTLQRVEAPPEQ